MRAEPIPDGSGPSNAESNKGPSPAGRGLHDRLQQGRSIPDGLGFRRRRDQRSPRSIPRPFPRARGDTGSERHAGSGGSPARGATARERLEVDSRSPASGANIRRRPPGHRRSGNSRGHRNSAQVQADPRQAGANHLALDAIHSGRRLPVSIATENCTLPATENCTLSGGHLVLATPKTDPQRNGVCRSTTMIRAAVSAGSGRPRRHRLQPRDGGSGPAVPRDGGPPRPVSVVDGRDAPSRPGRKAHNCHPSRGADGVSPGGP